jgi:hypothetical protein
MHSAGTYSQNTSISYYLLDSLSHQLLNDSLVAERESQQYQIHQLLKLL